MGRASIGTISVQIPIGISVIAILRQETQSKPQSTEKLRGIQLRVTDEP